MDELLRDAEYFVRRVQALTDEPASEEAIKREAAEIVKAVREFEEKKR